MSNCLNDERLQAVADGEGTEREIEHVRTCTGCGVRAANARDAIADFGHLMSELSVPPTLGSRVERAVAYADRGSERRGATTMRAVSRTLQVRPAWVFAGGAVAAVIALLFVVFPSVDSGTRLNAAEILNRSLQTLEGHGVERLEYELSIEAPGTVSIESGSYRIEQLIDHESGRWRLARFAADGTLLSGIREDPSAGVREALVRLDGRSYRFRFNVGANERVPLWDIQRRYAESMIRLVQASAGQVVTEETIGDVKRYIVQLSHGPVGGSASLFDLSQARVVVDGSDFHVVEFSASGAAMGNPISVGYRLLERVVAASPASASEFELPRDDSAAIELEGEGTRHIPVDVFRLLLREIGRSRP